MPPIVHLITGFKQSGKDTLHSNLKRGSIRYIPIKTRFRFPRPRNQKIMWLLSLICAIYNMIYEFFTGSVRNRQYIVMGNHMFSSAIFGVSHRERIAQADPIKDQVHYMLGLPPETNFESLKDQVHFDGRTLRDWYVKLGTDKRVNDADHWAKLTIERIKRSKLLVVDVTDFRFLNEYALTLEHFCVTSTRIFRRQVPIPSFRDATEHNLTHFETDALLIPSWVDYIHALWRFPRYASHVYMGDLVFVV